MSASYLWENYFRSLPEEDCSSAINYMLGALMADREDVEIVACIENVEALLREGMMTDQEFEDLKEDIKEDLKDDIEEAWEEYDKLQEEYSMLAGQRYHWLK